MKDLEEKYGFAAQLAALTNKQLVGRFNQEVGCQGWGNARSYFLTCLKLEFEKRQIDCWAISVVIDLWTRSPFVMPRNGGGSLPSQETSETRTGRALATIRCVRERAWHVRYSPRRSVGVGYVKIPLMVSRQRFVKTLSDKRSCHGQTWSK